jgi:hypothetical protein
MLRRQQLARGTSNDQASRNRSIVRYLLALRACGSIYLSVKILVLSTTKEGFTRLSEEQPKESSREEIARELGVHIYGAASLRMPRLRLSIDDSHVIRPGCSAQCPQEPPTFTCRWPVQAHDFKGLDAHDLLTAGT